MNHCSRLRLVSLLLMLIPTIVFGGTQVVRTQGHEITFSTQGGAPVSWVSCFPDCTDEDAVRATWFDNGDGYFLWSVDKSVDLSKLLAATDFSFTQYETDEHVVLTAVSDSAVGGNVVSIEYRIPKTGYRIELSATGLEPLHLTVASGDIFVPEQLPGFGAIYSKVRPLLLVQYEPEYIEPPAEGWQYEDMHVLSSIGLRNRYWVWVMKPGLQTTGKAANAGINRPVVDLAAARDSDFQASLYVGPTEFDSLKQASPGMPGLLFAAIWDWLRALSFGLLHLLDWLYSLVGNYGVAIILLSLTVKILMFPLTYVADKWQAQVNATASMLKPKLDEIKKNYSGEEAHNRILAVYKEHDVSQFYTLRSLFGFLIQIPVFIAAFDMLAENFVLSQASFLWIEDLSKPDSVLSLPFVLPFFGGELNLLPFVMTALTILSAIVQEEADLTPDLMRQQRIKLFLMAAAFFLLFYTFPAGMVLYWSANNLFHLLKILPERLRRTS